MRFKDILNYTIYEHGKFNITVDSLFVILTTILITILALAIVRKGFGRYIAKNETERRSFWSIYLIIKYLIWVVVIVIVLESSGVKVSIILASITALLVGIGFGIQQLFSDISSGIVLLIERNLQINDVIQIEDGTVGKVIHIGLRTSKLKTREDIILVVPNSKFVNDKIINWTQMDYNTRFFVEVGVAYGSDVKLVTDKLLQCALENKSISNSPSPFVRFDDFGESSLNFRLFFWVNESFRVENIKSQLRYVIYDEFRKNNIKIPLPQRDLHFRTNFPDTKTESAE